MAKCIYARCKRSIPPDAIFCPYCGRKQVREQKPKKHRTREKGTGSVYKLSGNRKRPYYAVLNGKSAGRMYATRQEAEAALESMLACTRPEVFSYTLEDCFNAWSSVAFRDMSTSSQRGYLTSWSYVPERLRQKLARDVRSDDFQEIVDALQGRGLSESTAKHLKFLYSQLCQWLMQRDVLNKNYAAFVTVQKTAKRPIETFTVEEIAKIIGVDSLGYLSLQDVVKLADNTEDGFCTACFGGGYPTSVPKDGGKDRFECKISEKEKQHA